MIAALAIALSLAQSVISPLGGDRPAPSFGQESWSRVAVHSSGVVARAWSGSGPDVYFQVPPHAPTMVNVVTIDQQDEPDVEALPVAAWPSAFVVAYDNRLPYMHVEYRRFGLDGAALSAPVRIDEQPTAWRPLIATRADGVVAFAWTGGWDNRSFVRLMDPSGAWLTQSIEVGVNVNGDQENPAPCWLASGELFVVFTDYHGGALGLELMSRTLAQAGGAWTGQPQRLVAAGVPGDQDWPVVEFDVATQSPWISWSDAAGVWLQRGVGTAPALLGPGSMPAIAPPFVAFQTAGATSDIALVNATGGPGGGPGASLVANAGTAGAQARPSLALAPGGGRLLVAWDGPSPSGTTNDAFVRLFAIH